MQKQKIEIAMPDMTRIEKNQAMAEEVADLKNEVVRSVKMSGGKKRWLSIGCSGIFLFTVLGFLGFLAWLAAAAGLARVPLLSAWAYQAPAPNHLVLPGLPLDTQISNELTAQINRRLAAGRGQILDRAVVLRLPEAGFTSLLRSSLEESGLKGFSAAGAQIAVIPDAGLELFLPLADNPQQSALVVELRLLPDGQGQLDLWVESLRLGSLSVPRAVYEPILKPLLVQNLANLNQSWGQYLAFERITYELGEVVVAGELILELLD